MAFSKNYTDQNTLVTVDYYKVYEVSVDPMANQTTATLGAFVNGTAPQAIASWNFTFDGQLSATDCEAQILLRPEFSDAVKI